MAKPSCRRWSKAMTTLLQVARVLYLQILAL